MVSDSNEWTCQGHSWFWRYERSRARLWLKRNGYRAACVAVALLVAYAVTVRIQEIHAAGGFVIGPTSSTRG